MFDWSSVEERLRYGLELGLTVDGLTAVKRPKIVRVRSRRLISEIRFQRMSPSSTETLP